MLSYIAHVSNISYRISARMIVMYDQPTTRTTATTGWLSHGPSLVMCNLLSCAHAKSTDMMSCIACYGTIAAHISTRNQVSAGF